MSHIGTLEQFNLSSVLLRIETHIKTGRLKIEQGVQWVELYFRDGCLMCIGPTRTNAALGDRLLQDGVISAQALQETLLAIGVGRPGETRMALALMERGCVTQEGLRTWAIRKATEVLQVLLHWPSGNVYFYENEAPPSDRLLVAISISSLLASIPAQNGPAQIVHPGGSTQRASQAMPYVQPMQGNPGIMNSPQNGMVTPAEPASRTAGTMGGVQLLNNTAPLAPSTETLPFVFEDPNVSGLPVTSQPSGGLDLRNQPQGTGSQPVQRLRGSDLLPPQMGDFHFVPPSSGSRPSQKLHSTGQLPPQIADESFTSQPAGDVSQPGEKLRVADLFGEPPISSQVSGLLDLRDQQPFENSFAPSSTGGFGLFAEQPGESAPGASSSSSMVPPVPVGAHPVQRRIDTSTMRPEMVLMPADLSVLRDRKPSAVLTPDQWRLLTKVDGRTTLQAASQELAMPPALLCQVAGELYLEGLIILSTNAPREIDEHSPVSREMAAAGLSNGYLSPAYEAAPVSPWSTAVSAPQNVYQYAAVQSSFETEAQWGNGGNGATFTPGRGWTATSQPVPHRYQNGHVAMPYNSGPYGR